MSETLPIDIDEAVRSAMAALKVPGCAYALIESGAITRVRAHGMAHAVRATRVSVHTRFSLQSISKSIAAWTVMTLVEQDRIDLDAPISRYLRRWSLPLSQVFDVDRVTPRRLLSHRAGVTAAGFRGVEPQRIDLTLLDAMNAKLPPPTDEQRRHWAYWKLPEDEPVSITEPPGKRWLYSNPGFALLELMVEDVTGEPYADYASRAVLRPLGLAASSFDYVDGPGFATPHGRDGAPGTNYRMLCLAAAGVYAPITDLAAFACAGMQGPGGEPPGRGVLRPETVAAMYTSQGAADQTGGVAFEAGLGHLLLQTGDRLNVHHSGGSIGWRSIFSIFPETGDGICMVMNGEAANELWVPIVKTWRETLAS